MPVNKNALLNALKTKPKQELFSTLQTNPDPTIEREIHKCLAETKSLLKSIPVKETIEYLLDQDRWNEYSCFSPRKDQFANYKLAIEYPRGSLVSVQFGFNFGKELSDLHMGIVIANYSGFVDVVPVTSAFDQNGQQKLAKYSPELQQAIILVEKLECPRFDTDSILLIPQIKVISKNRIRKHIGDVNDTDLLERIEWKIVEVFAPTVKDRIEALKGELEAKTKELAEMLNV